jgi:hypothetical protein
MRCCLSCLLPAEVGVIRLRPTSSARTRASPSSGGRGHNQGDRIRGSLPNRCRVVASHDVKQRSFFVPAARFCVRVVFPSHLTRTFLPTPTEGWAERREAIAFNLVALVRRDATLARREPSRATGRPPLGAPPWRFRPRVRLHLRHCRRIRCEGSTPPGIWARLRPRASRSAVTSRGRRHSPLRLQDRLRRTPLIPDTISSQ